LLAEYEDQDPANALVTTVADERNINTFFRLWSKTVIDRLRETFPSMSKSPEPREVFLKLRELRNKW
jgi:hydroxyacylglutathione hydrolase